MHGYMSEGEGQIDPLEDEAEEVVGKKKDEAEDVVHAHESPLRSTALAKLGLALGCASLYGDNNQ